MAALTIPGSKLTDILVRKRCLIGGLAVYGSGAVIAAVAPGLGILSLGYSGHDAIYLYTHELMTENLALAPASATSNTSGANTDPPGWSTSANSSPERVDPQLAPAIDDAKHADCRIHVNCALGAGRVRGRPTDVSPGRSGRLIRPARGTRS